MDAFAEKAFKRKRIIPGALENFGFVKSGSDLVYVAEIMNGDFSVFLTCTRDGELRGSVIDRMNDEEYAPLFSAGFNGAYVNAVRSAYSELLLKIADACCEDLPFVSDQANRLTALIARRLNTSPDFPFHDDKYGGCGVFRHADSQKWFGIIMNVRWDVLQKNRNTEKVDVINLKIDPARREELLSGSGIYPAYHMNHKNWISVALCDVLLDEEVFELVKDSFLLTEKNAKKRGG